MSSNSVKNDPGQSSEFQDNLNLLRQIPVFSALPLESLKVFAYLCTREAFKDGEFLFHQEEDDGQAYYLISGTAVLIHTADNGDKEIDTYGPGSFIGGLTLLGKSPRLFSLKAVEDTNCLIMRRERFAKTIEQFQDLMPKYLHTMVNRIYRWEKQLLADSAENDCKCLKKTGVSLV